jgi:hypothetical protein
MSNFRLGFPTIQSEATLTASHTASTTRPSTNLFSGARSDRFELASTTSDCITLNYDLGVSTATSNFLAIMRAKLLAASGCSGVRLRGSTQQAFLPSTLSPTLWLDSSRGVTTVSGAISQINDQSASGIYDATQGTAGNRAYLSTSGSQENLVRVTNDTSSGSFGGVNRAAVQASTTIAAGSYNIQFLKEDNTVGNTHQLEVGAYLPIVSGISYRVSFRGYSTNRGVRVRNLDGLGDRSIYINLTSSAAVSTDAGITSFSATSLGGGVYEYSFLLTASSTNLTSRIIFYLTNAASSTTTVYNGDNVSGAYIGCVQVQAASATSTYLENRNAFPLYQGINGNKSAVHDLSNDYFNISLPINPTGGMWCYVAFKIPRLPTGQAVIAGGYGGAGTRLQFKIMSDGAVNAILLNGTGAYIGRATAAGCIVANTATVLGFEYDGTTNPTGIKIFKGSTQVDTSTTSGGVYTVPTAGVDLKIGSDSGGASFFEGHWPELVYCQGSTLSVPNRTALIEYLTTRYITTPLVSVDFPATYNGGQADDYLTTFTESAAFKHYWLQFNTETTSKFKVAKAFFGKALDLGREPVYPLNISKSKDNPWSRAAAYTADLNFEAVTDSKKSELIELIKKPELALVALDSEDVLFRGALGIDCSIAENDVEPFYATENDLSITLKENI